jgi:hypothetical protein
MRPRGRWELHYEKVRNSYTARLHNRLVCRRNIDRVINDEHKRIIIVVLAKQEIAPWWWFLREPKHVEAIVGILIVFNIPVMCISWNNKKVLCWYKFLSYCFQYRFHITTNLKQKMRWTHFPLHFLWGFKYRIISNFRRKFLYTFPNWKLGVVLNSRYYFSIYESGKHNFPRRTNSLPETVVNVLESEMYCLARNFFLKIPF